MKRKFALCVVILVVVMAMFCSCKEPEDQYEKYPLKGLAYSEPQYDANVLVGTYLAADYVGSNMFGGYGCYYWVSFKSDGTLIASPAKGKFSGSPIDKEPATGTWVIDGSDMTISVFDKTYTGTKIDSAGNGFAIKRTSSDNIAFAKVSNSYIDTKIASDKSKICGLYFSTDKYGDNFGYRFLSGDKAWEYYGSNSSIEESYKISTKGTVISIDGWPCNVTFIGDYLVIDGVFYQKVK